MLAPVASMLCAESHQINSIILSMMKMDFVTFVRRFKFFFSLCGIGEFNIQAKVSRTWKARLTDNLLALLYLLVVIVMYCLAFYGRMVSPVPLTSVNSLLAFIHVCCEFLLHLMIAGQTLFYREKMKRLVRSYEYIQQYMLTRMNYSVGFGNLGKRFILMIAVLFIPCLGMLIWRLIGMLTNGLSCSLIIVIFYVLSAVAQFHIIVHIELLKFFLHTTSQWVGTRATKVSVKGFQPPSNMLRKQYSAMLHLKWIHFKLYELSTNINHIFGWSLAVMFLRNAVEIAYGSYWFYLVYSFMDDRKYDYTGLIRKKIRFYSICVKVLLRRKMTLYNSLYSSSRTQHCSLFSVYSALKSHHIVRNVK